MANLPSGSSGLPGITTLIETVSNSVSIPNGTRLAAIVGLGLKSEVVVATAQGGGKDGLDPTYTTTTGSDSRHFALKNAPVVSNRTQLFKNGIPLNGLEEVPDSNPFDNRYDYRIDIATGHIELQTAYLVDQGGLLYSIGATNVGLGNLDGYSGPQLVDINAPTETWTIKCVSVQRNALSQPIQQTAKFLAFGSVSGMQLDSYGNPITWISNGQQVSNGIIEFAISETQNAGSSVSPFREGDYFTIKVKSGSLNKNDTLTANYIAESDLNDWELFSTLDDVITKYGPVTTDNTLSLGAYLAFSNSPPALYAMQAMPSLPRRTSYVLVESFNATSTNINDFVIPLPIGVVPDDNSAIHVFVTDPTTKIETQLLPNKFPFYTLDTSGQPSTNTFVFSDTNPPAGWSFSYSVNQGLETLNFGNDGYLNRSLTSHTLATFSVDGTVFTEEYVGKQVKIFDATNLANNGSWAVLSVSDGNLNIEATGTTPFTPFVNGTSVHFDVINPVDGSIVASSTGTDGVLVAIPSSSTATFSSVAVNFTAIPALTGMKLNITSSTTATNIGLFDIVSVDGSDNLTISKSFVSEDNLNYEVQDPDETSDYLVLNHNIVPNGNSLRITLVDSRDADFFDAGWVEAFEKLETLDCDIVVPLPQQTISVIFQNALNHCITMSNLRNKRERVLYTGAIAGLEVDNLTGAEPAAVEDIGVLEGIQGNTVAEVLSGNTEDLTNYSVPDSFGFTYRAVYFYPDQISAVVGGEDTLIDGFYIAAAAAGYTSATAYLGMPLTNKVISGFNILRNKNLSVSDQEALVSAGVCVLQPDAGGGRVIWGITTTQSGAPEEQEISSIFIRDKIAKSLRTGFQGYIGLASDADSIPMLTTRAKSLFDGFVSQKLLISYSSLAVTQDSVDPRQFNITAQCVLVGAINWIFCRVGVSL